MGKSRVDAHRKTDAKLKSKRGDASKEVAKDPNKLKRPIKFEAKVVRFFSFCCCSAAFRLCRNTVFLHATELLNFLISKHLRSSLVPMLALCVSISK
ncbi:uncharacterized protein LOC126589264 [Malus sylvestris]|uniref:uncharacterized protein LOC126589264 n=1 Tax=Malus sylvestris TaxID=3752 RepID=UPI0007EDEC0E|nr:uncharacterized protein LOC103412688 [Malus domestica]XP_050110476.1 uncharacterized protein LOC126589264 [Malus sylvestris]